MLIEMRISAPSQAVAKKIERFARDLGGLVGGDAPIPVELAFPNVKPGDYLAGIRCREDLTQDEMAKKLGICRSNLSAMERGKRPIGKALAKKIAGIFGGSYKSFL